MGVNGIKREVRSSGKFYDFSSHGCQFATENVMLRTGSGEVGSTMKAQL
jgi:hypothetical protein